MLFKVAFLTGSSKFMKTFVLYCEFQDKYLDRFLSLCTVLEDGNIPPRIGEANMEPELKTRYDVLCLVSAVSITLG
jgi:hypothetical protein